MAFKEALSALFVPSDAGLTTLALRSGPNPNDPSTPLNSPANINLALQMLSAGAPTAAGEVVGERNALENPTVFTCVSLIASGVAQIPFRVYEQDQATKTEAPEHSLSYLVTTAPNSEMTAFTFLETLAGSLCLTGNAYAEIERDDVGQPMAFWPLNPLNTEPFRMPDGHLVYLTTDGMQNDQKRVIASEDMLHCKLFSLDGLKGISPITQLRQEIGFAQATTKAGGRVLANGMAHSAVVSPKVQGLTPKQIDEARAFLENQATGVNRGRMAFVPFEFSLSQLTMTMADAEFIALRNMSREMICGAFHVDPHYAGDTTRQASANHEQAALAFIQDTLQPYLLRIEQEFRRKLLPQTGRTPSRYTFGFDLTARLRSDIKTTLEAIGTGRQWSVLSVDEARAMVGLNPVGGKVGSSLLQPVNMLNADIGVDFTPQSNTPKDK